MNKKSVLIPIPKTDFDPTEVAIPWRVLTAAGVDCVFATPDGRQGECDQRMLHGTGLGLLAPLLAADSNARSAYREMSISDSFKKPLPWSQINIDEFDGVILAGGHAPGMREYLESNILQKIVSMSFAKDKIVGAICHGVVLAARSRTPEGHSVLKGRKTTALLASQELSAWALTCVWLGSYYRTYPVTVESEVRDALASSTDFVSGPLAIQRDSSEKPHRGFAMVDRNYISARWPGDAHAFAHAVANALLNALKIFPLDPNS